LQALVKAGADPCQGPASHVFVDGPLTLTPMLYACDRNNDDAILFLLAQGADPDVQRSDGEWALQLAMEKCRRETIEALIAFGADPFAVNRDGIDVLHSAALWRRADIVPIILKAGVDPSQNVEIDTGMRSAEGYNALDLARLAADPDSSDTPFDKTISLLVAATRRATKVVPS
jgi:ankyrin repeat protein